MNKIKAAAIVLLLVLCGILAEAGRPDCNEFDRSQMPYWSSTDYQIYANCK